MISCLAIFQCQIVSNLNSLFQYLILPYHIDSTNFTDFECNTFGLWSRYNPLGNITQVGDLGVLDSNCYHLFSIREQTTNEPNLIYYDCLDIQIHSIKKVLIFYDQNQIISKFEIPINTQEYESKWYFFNFMIIPKIQKFQFAIFSQTNHHIFYEQVAVEFPFKDVNLNIVIGGSLIVNNNQVLYNSETSKLSFFPGKFRYLHPYFLNKSFEKCELSTSEGYNKEFNNLCYCQLSQFNFQSMINIKNLDVNYYHIEFPNCNAFRLQSWVRLTNINIYNQQILYQLIKLCANFQNQILIDENLSAFQLFYKLTHSHNQLIVTTYSYTFPSVNMDFKNNPFIIKKEFDLNHNISKWHYLAVQKTETSIIIQIFFYEGLKQYSYVFESQVYQFQNVQFQVIYGNILKCQNCLNVQMMEFSFNNCVYQTPFKNECHNNCKECDGPTKSDCLSCWQSSNRIYQEEFKQCICPYGTIDFGDQCYDYNIEQLNLDNQNLENSKCPYSYFENDGQCVRCPSIIQDLQVTCIECLINPKGWINNPYCEYDYISNNILSPFQQIQQVKTYYLFDGNDLILCNNCENSYDLFQDYISTTKKNCQFLNQWTIMEECFSNTFIDCDFFKIQVEGTLCIECKDNYEKDKNQCVLFQPFLKIQICEIPQYRNYLKKCELCPIKNCIYCFDFNLDDFTRNTLSFTDILFDSDEAFQVGCALCQDGFIYDFIIKECKYKDPSIENCLRSYINVENQEICTLSQLDDFSIAPSIINCQKYINYCEECLLTYSQILKCIICEDGYLISTITGLCQIDQSLSNVAKYFSCNRGKHEAWIQLTQAFARTFWNSIRLNSLSDWKYDICPLKCQDGYKLQKNNCIKYCDSDCQVCQKTTIKIVRTIYTCSLCQLNYYNQPIRTAQLEKCLICPPLCILCQERSTNQILQINKYFQISDENDIYTQICLKSILSPNVYIDPDLQISRYCYHNECDSIFEKYIENDCALIQFQTNSKKFIEYSNQIGLKYFAFILNLFGDISCSDIGGFKNNLKEQIFSLQMLILKFQGILIYESQIITIQKYDEIEFTNLQIFIQNDFQANISNRDSPLNFKIIDSKIYSTQQLLFQISIIVEKCVQFFINNFQILNIRITNSNLFQINYDSNLNKNTSLNNLQFQDSVFYNSILYNLMNIQNNVLIDYLIIERCEFINSTIFQFETQYFEQNVSVIIKQVVIKNSIFKNSSLILNNKNNRYRKLWMQSFQFFDNQFSNCEFINFDQNTFAFDFEMISNSFIQSILFSIKVSNLFQINKLSAIKNQFKNFIILNTEKQTSQQSNITIINLDIKNNIHFEDMYKHMFIVISSTIQIYNVQIENTYNERYFYMFDVYQIKMQNIQYKNDIQQLKIPQSSNCLKNIKMHSQLIYVFGFQNLLIENVQIFNQLNIDVSIFEILSNTLELNYEVEKVTFKNISFYGNILLKIGQGNLFSLISIYSEKEQEIELENIQFQQNAFNQYAIDPTKSSSSLLFINSFRSSILANNITSYQNVITNSTQTFILIFSKQIEITNIKAQYHNYLEVQFWNQYYDIFLESIFTQSQINYLIHISYSFSNKGGLMEVNSQQFSLTNGLFQYIIAQSSSLFKIISQGDGIIIISDCNFLNAENYVQSNLESDGALTIDSSGSFLFMALKNFTFVEIENKFAPSVFSIYTSPYKNKILLEMIKIENCYSLRNSFLQLNSVSNSINENQVLIDNLRIISTTDKLTQFHNKLDYLEPLLLQQIVNNNAIINIAGCKVQIKNLQIEGILMLPLFRIVDCSRVVLINIQIDGIYLYFQQSLIQIEQIEFRSNTIQITNIIIQNIKIGEFQKLNLSYNFQPTISESFQKCNKIKFIYTQSYNQIIRNSSNLFQQIKLRNNKEGSLIYLKSFQNSTKIQISSLKILNNDCQICWNGLIYLYLNDFSNIMIQDLQCINNIVRQFGCINAFADQKQNGKINIKQCNYIYNQGTYGIAIQSNQVQIYLSKSKILNNTAILFGGGLYLKLYSEDFKIQKTIIIYNKAKEGGGIYLNGTSRLKKENFNQSLIILNFALGFANNVKESASHLDLNINNQQMMFTQQQIGNKSIKILKMNTYKIVSQGQMLYTNVLMIPSNQIIQQYRIYDVRLLKFISYISQVSITFKNQMDEQLRNFSNTYCTIAQQIQDVMTNKVLDYKNISQVQFNEENSNIDLSTQMFQFDPYQHINKTYEIQILCRFSDESEELQYNLQVKSFFCQLGEFYAENGCQICESNQGYYSVIYNTTKCSLFDKNKFQAITSNNIELQKGYWRPNFLCDIIDQCFKNMQFCKGGWTVGDDLCTFGHIGGLCEQCDKYNIRGDGSFFQNEQTLECFDCNDLSNSILAFLLTSIWALLINLITVRSIQNTNKRYTSYQLSQRFGYILFKLNLDQESILLKLFLNYLWIFSIIFTFNTNFTFNFISRANDTSYFMASTLDCQLIEIFNFELIYSRIMASYVLILCQVILIQIIFNLFTLVSQSKVDSNLISITILYLFIQNYTALIKQLFSILAKRQISNLDYIQGDVSLQYGQNNHLNWIFLFAIPALAIIGVVLPFSLLIILYIKKNNLNQIKFRRHIGYLFNEYTIQNYYWEWVKLWKKTVIIILLIYFETQVILKGTLIGITLVFYQLFALKFSPYINQKLNKLDVKAGQYCLLSINLAVVKYICDQQDNYFISQITSIFIIIICIKLSVPFVFSIIRTYYRKHKIYMVTLILKLLKKQTIYRKITLIFSAKLESWRQYEVRLKQNIQKLRKIYISKRNQDSQGKQRIFTRYTTMIKYPQINTETNYEDQVKQALNTSVK
ncbi:unnamed protein product [Paramecium sonneborni]|uniref:Transmembrane protein n=1 Tax=Paramecium sonneborni TaxID=65129 RepID=A0A8S1RB47_9CILI|nr:unnamed protein product [Paramecium sonneborni]